MKGKLILVVAPSGSGKGTVISHIRDKFPEITYPITSTTRIPRPREVDGVAYNFLSRGEFERRAAAGDFLEWNEYGGNLYGTPKKAILDALEEGKIVLRELEVKGAKAIKKILPPEDLAVVYIDGGGWESLERRIVKRAPISEGELERRKNRYMNEEKDFIHDADYVIHNYDGKLDGAKGDAERTIEEIIEKNNQIQ